MSLDYRLQLFELQQGRKIEDIISEGFAAGKSLLQLSRDLELPYPTLYSWGKRRGMVIEQSVRFDGNEAQ